MQCIGYFKLLFYLLRLPLSPEVQQAALEVVSVVTTNQECVNDIAASEVLASLLLVIPTLPKSTLLILETIYALISNTKIVKEIMVRGNCYTSFHRNFLSYRVSSLKVYRILKASSVMFGT